MNCREAERLIDTFYDGELDGRSMRDAAMHITRCKRCEAELNQREQVQKLLSGTIEAEIADIDLGKIWAAVEPTIAQASTRQGARRLAWAEGPSVAATSARVGGLLLGRKHVVDQPSDDLDPASWDAPAARSGRLWRWTLAGGAALAASVLLALAIVPREAGSPGDLRVAAGRSSSAPEAARAPAPAALVAQRGAVAGADEPFAVAGTGMVRTARAANKQVQVESVEFPRSSVSMWSEPASETTVIWISDEEQAASGRR